MEIDGVKSSDRKFRPLTVRVGPPDIAMFGETMAVRTGASNVIKPTPVPTILEIVSPTFFAIPYPGTVLHATVVDDDQDAVVHNVPPGKVAVTVRSSATKFKPNKVRYPPAVVGALACTKPVTAAES